MKTHDCGCDFGYAGGHDPTCRYSAPMTAPDDPRAARLEAQFDAVREVVRAAHILCDNTANDNPPGVDQEDWNALSAALDKVDDLIPDNEQPACAGYLVSLLEAATVALQEENASLRNNNQAVKALFDERAAQLAALSGSSAAPQSSETKEEEIMREGEHIMASTDIRTASPNESQSIDTDKCFLCGAKAIGFVGERPVCINHLGFSTYYAPDSDRNQQ